jgi:hypothetical protein
MAACDTLVLADEKMEECPMADLKNARFIVKHVDGVMHLIPNPNGQAVGDVPHLRTLPPVVEPAEQKN